LVTVDSIEAVLSPQQQTALALSGTGLSTTQVAAALQIPVHEARAHLTSAIARLNAQSKLEAVIFALRHGLILPPHD
jgi:two-component system nitrate/nitrite response regulator NarL